MKFVGAEGCIWKVVGCAQCVGLKIIKVVEPRTLAVVTIPCPSCKGSGTILVKRRGETNG